MNFGTAKANCSNSQKRYQFADAFACPFLLTPNADDPAGKRVDQRGLDIASHVRAGYIAGVANGFAEFTRTTRMDRLTFVHWAIFLPRDGGENLFTFVLPSSPKTLTIGRKCEIKAALGS